MKAITCGFFLLLSTFLVAQEFGIASYYADSFEGISTASGEAYAKAKFTCAHNSYPFGTMLKITCLDNNKSVKVRVNDRGPFIKGRVVDLSRVAAEQLDLIRAGTTQVRVDVADGAPTAPVLTDANTKGGGGSGGSSKATKPAPAKSTAPAKRPDTYVDKNVPKDKPVAKRSSTTTSKPVAKPTSGSSSTRPAKNYAKYGLYQIQLMTPKKRGYGVQVASFASYDNVMAKVAQLQGKWFDEILVKSEPGSKGAPVYKVVLGNFDSLSAAENYKKNLRAKHAVKGFVINLDE